MGEPRALHTRLLDVRNDFGLLSEQYDPRSRAMLGNFQRPFAHVSLVNTAMNLMAVEGPARHRPSDVYNQSRVVRGASVICSRVRVRARGHSWLQGLYRHPRSPAARQARCISPG